MVKKERKTYTEIAEDAEITEKREGAVRKQLADMGAAVLAPIGVREREEEKPKDQVKNRYLGHPNPRGIAAKKGGTRCTILPVRGPTRQKVARERESGHSGRDDSF